MFPKPISFGSNETINYESTKTHPDNPSFRYRVVQKNHFKRKSSFRIGDRN